MNVWHDPANQVVIHDLPDPSRVLAAVPGARHLANGYVASPANLYSLQLLTWLGLPVPRPMDAYDWPIRRPWKPLAHQRVMANFMALHPRCFNFSDMGSMKTMAALWAADFVMSQYPPGECRALIVAPLSILQRVWGDAIFQNFLGRRTFVILHGDARKREQLLAEPHDFYIINFDGLAIGAPNQARNPGQRLFGVLEVRTDLRMVIIDEASAYRDSTTRRHKVARRLFADRDYLWLMTGTPTPNAPTDAYGLAKLVNNAQGESFRSFQDRTMFKLTQFKWVPRAGAQAEAFRLMQPAIRFAIEDCVELPPNSTQQRDVAFSDAQKTAYKAMERDLQLTLREGKTVSAANEAVLRLKLIQIACGAIYGADRSIHKVDAAPRIAALREVLAETSDKVIVFAPLTSVLHLLHSELRDEFFTEIVNGEVSPNNRAEIFRAFQAEEKPRVLLADPRTMAHGLTLTAATTIVWYAPTDSTEIYLQANKRIDRPGQTKATTIVQLASTSIEREIYRRLAANERMQGAILAMARGGKEE